MAMPPYRGLPFAASRSGPPAFPDSGSRYHAVMSTSTEERDRNADIGSFYVSRLMQTVLMQRGGGHPANLLHAQGVSLRIKHPPKKGAIVEPSELDA